jgi:hypothetical protein
MYQLGSLAMFMFTGVGTTAALAKEIGPQHLWGNWTGSFPEVLPYVRDAFDRVARSFTSDTPEEFRGPLSTMFRYLCDPDPSLRGDPKDRRANPFSFERFVSRFDLLARRAELSLKGTIML